MNVKKLVSYICIVAILCMPLKVSAQEPIIRMLSLEEAEELYYQMLADKEIQVCSDLGTCELGISKSDDKLLVIYSTGCRGTASKIGVRNLTLERKDGLVWKDIVVKSDYSENTDAYLGGFYLNNPEAGKSYKAHCIHYAVKDGKELSLYTETNPYVYN